MKKRVLVLSLTLISLALVILFGVVIAGVLKEKENDKGNGKIQDGENVQNISQTYEDSQQKSTEEIDYTEPFEKNGIIYELLDCQMVDKLEDYPGYNAEDIWYEDKPLDGTDIKMEPETDYEAVYQEMPEYKDYVENEDAYTIEEGCKILEDAADVIERHSVDVEVPYDYLFLKCRVTNTLKHAEEIWINDQVLYILKDGKWDDKTTNPYYPVYFDQVVRDGELSFFQYNLGKGETLEYTVALAIREKESEGEYYYGLPDVIRDEEGVQQDPTLQTMYMRHLPQPDNAETSADDE